jgi:hypothetical protein
MGFAVKFDRARLEDVLNQHAEQGYRVIAAVSMEFTSHGAPHDELVVLLERV